MRLIELTEQLSVDLLSSGRFRTCAAYRSVVRSVSDFCSPNVPTLGMVYTKDFLCRYEEHLHLCGLRRNTISFYMTVLRMIYNSAVDLGKLPFSPGLFSHVFTGNDPTGKRAVGSEVIARLHYADLSAVPRLERCRDLFLLSFYLQGMSFIDLAYLQKNDIRDDDVFYRRHKTGGLVCLSLLDAARELMGKFEAEVFDSPYVLPIVTLPGLDGRRQYQNALRNQNRHLKALAAYLGIEENLTSYVARHSWATLAYHNGVDVSLVSQAMGHHTEEVTRIYLSSFEHERLAEANRVVLNAVLRPIREGRVQQIYDELGLSGRELSLSQDDIPASESIESQHENVRKTPRGNRADRGDVLEFENDGLLTRSCSPLNRTKNVRHYGNEGHR